MKKFKIQSLLLVLISLFLNSCNVEPLDPDLLNNIPNPQVDVVFKTDFEGATWEATSATAFISGNLIRIEGVKANGEGFGFILSGNGVGTFPANSNIVTYTPANSEFGYWAINPANESENTGTVNITNVNTTAKTLSGNFDFKGYWSDATVTTIPPIFFTNGLFTNIPYVIVSPTEDTFFAKVDGVEYIDTDILTSIFTINNVELLSIGTQTSSNTSMTITVDNNLTTGTYPITGSIANDVVQARYVVNNVTYAAQSGSVTITSKTATRIVGTFSYVTNGTTPFTVTEGAFDVAY
jgi:hypothetical protein